ncbi:MAG: RagB/SusD family nutrient uptake outer membrane protein [Chryseobacterium sp.]|uniref:RagB/SusD family nutrient uptake outer membrane protein n=1 Tax=Chryseobacterium sp. TaxID=1871047 RepID=UPI001B280FBC|nr:RagB/SusD family nutrient uptake outer membrane protein [Chryseobacterium sp.]MBO6183346.1 RagB/SusD family nutrient uptake outer membrane protein [Chryseobacterium sp.]
MKKNIKYAFFIGAALLGGNSILTSCSDAYEIVQPGETHGEDITTVDGMNNLLIGSVYGLLEPTSANYLTAVVTDEVRQGIGSGGQEWQLHRHFIDPSDSYTGTIWLNNYTVINRVNRLLEIAEKITPTTTAQGAAYKRILGEARAIRAYCYLQLETYFSTDMKDENALGVMLVTTAPSDLNFSAPRVANKVIYDLINADLDFARANVATTGSNVNRFYVNRSAVNAIAARFNLYRGNYPLAKQYADLVLTGSGINLTTANPMTNGASGPNIGTSAWNTVWYGTTTAFNPYRTMWADLDRTDLPPNEVIFGLNRLAPGSGLAIGTLYNTNTSNINGGVMWFWGVNMFNEFYGNANDVRKYAYLDPSSLPYLGDDYYVIDKFPGKSGGATRNDVKVFRLSEMYFILAEAAVEAGDFAGAANYIQQVRVARAFTGTPTTPAYTSKQVAYKDILKERRIELALEGHRYIDLKRLAATAGVTMDRSADDDIAGFVSQNLPNGSYKYTLPIPLAEMTANAGVSGQQNPGYK